MVHKRGEKDTDNPPGQIVNKDPRTYKTLKEYIERVKLEEEELEKSRRNRRLGG